MNMRKRILVTSILYLGLCASSHSQELKTFENINVMWSKFSQAFDALDYKKIADIHTKNLIRIPNGKQLLNYDTYLMTYKIDFEQAKKTTAKRAISFRFYKRIHNDSIASEIGVYKVEMDNQTYYGKFHVLLAKENGDWKIFMDYDSNEEGTIGEDDYMAAMEMTNFNTFLKQ